MVSLNIKSTSMLTHPQTSQVNFTQILPQLAEQPATRLEFIPTRLNYCSMYSISHIFQPFLFKVWCFLCCLALKSQSPAIFVFTIAKTKHSNWLKGIPQKIRWPHARPISFKPVRQPEFQFPNKQRDWYLRSGTCQHRYRSDINITQGDERFRHQSVGGQQNNKPALNVFLLNT